MDNGCAAQCRSAVAAAIRSGRSGRRSAQFDEEAGDLGPAQPPSADRGHYNQDINLKE